MISTKLGLHVISGTALALGRPRISDMRPGLAIQHLLYSGTADMKQNG
jgi:hypothetical protein